MTTENWKSKIFAVSILLFLAVMCIQPVSADSLGGTDIPIFSIPEKTTIYDTPTISENAVLSTDTYSSLNIPEFLTASSNAKKLSKEIAADSEIYNVVSFNNPIPVRSENVKLDIMLYGVEYTVNLERMPENIDDGIDSYYGTIEGIADSEVILTVDNNNLLIGSIAYPGEYLTITTLPINAAEQVRQNPLHVVYSEYDILQSTESADFCGVPDTPVSGVAMVDSQIKETADTKGAFDLVTIDLLVVTDNAFATANPNWVSLAESYIAAANSATSYGRDDVKVYLNVISYDSSRKMLLSNHYDVDTDPLNALKGVYPTNYLDSIGADICLYLGGYDRVGDNGTAQGQASLINGIGRYAWSQMVADGFTPYVGDDNCRKFCIIHELGHCLGGVHEQAYTEWFGQSLVVNTVMLSEYYGSLYNLHEFSSTYSSSYLGDADHDNAKEIRNRKTEVSLMA